jgi:hypothetical protein
VGAPNGNCCHATDPGEVQKLRSVRPIAFVPFVVDFFKVDLRAR